MKNIGNENTLYFAATHDVELTYMFDDNYRTRNFLDTGKWK
ncbi:MAG: hypothetical protein ACRDDE_07500 [Paraclostridium sp.]